VAQRVTDVLLSYIDFDTMEVDPAAIKRKGDKQPAVPGMVALLKKCRTSATAKMTEVPTYFEKQPYILNAKNAKGFVVRKPADVGDFIVQEFLLSTEDRYPELETVFVSIGLTIEDASQLNTLALGTLANVSQALFSSGDVKQQMLTAIDESAKP
jgi:hypothetical protein